MQIKETKMKKKREKKNRGKKRKCTENLQDELKIGDFFVFKFLRCVDIYILLGVINICYEAAFCRFLTPNTCNCIKTTFVPLYC